MNVEYDTARRCQAASSEAVAFKLAALSHPARLEILRRLGGGRSCCCKEVVEHLDLAQSTVSQHLKILVEAGLVRYAPERQRSRYEIDPQALAAVSASVAALVETCCATAPQATCADR